MKQVSFYLTGKTRKEFTMRKCLFALAIACSFGQMAQAGLISYVTPNSAQAGAPGSVQSVSGEADFTLGNGTLTLTLQNYTADPIADTQMISGIKFNVSGHRLRP